MNSTNTSIKQLTDEAQTWFIPSGRAAQAPMKAICHEWNMDMKENPGGC